MADRPARRPLHVGIDGRELVGRPTGVGRFLSRILDVWARDRNRPDRFTLFLPAEPEGWIRRLGPAFTYDVTPGHLAGTWWEQVRLPARIRRAAVDVLLAPGYTMPLLTRCPAVVVIHDVSFFAHPEWFRWREGLRRRWLTRASARRARVVLTVSEFSAREIARHTGVPAADIRIVRHGSPASSAGATGFAEPAEDRPPLVLFVGSLFNRRRLPELIGGFARAAGRIPGARLVLVGDNRTAPRIDPLDLAARAGAAGAVEWRDYVSDAELERLYRTARLFVFLSDYEGFAMTPLEAIAWGAPPLLLDTPVAREVYGGAARYVPPDEAAIAEAIEALLTDGAARAALLAEGRGLLERYTWERAAAVVRAALDEAAGRV